MVFLISPLHSLTLKVWIVICHIFDLLEQLIMSYCASGGRLGFSVWLLSQSFSLWRFLPTHSVLHLHNNFCDTACPASSPILNPHLHNYTIVLSNTYVYAVVYTFKILWHLYLVNNLLIVALYIAC